MNDGSLELFTVAQTVCVFCVRLIKVLPTIVNGVALADVT